MKYKTSVGGQDFEIEINRDDEVIVNGRPVPVDYRWLEGNAIFSLLIERNSYETLVEEHDGRYDVLLHGRMFNVRVEDEGLQRLKRAGLGFAVPFGEIAIKAPMPGLIVTTPVAVGQTVRKGDVLVILESMKMQNEIRAPRDGKVAAVRVEPRQVVELNQILVVIS